MKNVKWKNILQLQAVVIIYIKCYGKSSIRTQRRTLVIFTLFRIGIYTIGNLCIAMAANDQEI